MVAASIAVPDHEATLLKEKRQAELCLDDNEQLDIGTACTVDGVSLYDMHTLLCNITNSKKRAGTCQVSHGFAILYCPRGI